MKKGSLKKVLPCNMPKNIINPIHNKIPKTILGCAEIKEITDYVKKTNKEIHMIIDDEKRKNKLRSRENQSIFRTKRDISKDSYSFSSGFDKNLVKTTSKGNITPSIQLKLKTFSDIPTPPTIPPDFDIEEQIKSRREARKITLKKLSEQDERRKERIRLEQKQWEENYKKLKKIERRRNNIIIIIYSLYC